MRQYYAYVGNWDIPDRAKKGGITVMGWDPDREILTSLGTVLDHINCGSIHINQEKGLLYVTDERDHPAGKQTGGGSIYTLKIDPDTGMLSELGCTPSYGVYPCGIAEVAGKGLILVSNLSGVHGCTKVLRELNGTYTLTTIYDDSNLVLFRKAEDGTLSAPCDVHHHYGRGPHPVQTHPRLHSVTADPSGERFLVCDKGTDGIYLYRVDPEKGTILRTGHAEASVPGSGPRYGVFHPTLPVLYHNNELIPDVCAFRIGAEDSLEEIGRWSALPEGFVPKEGQSVYETPSLSDIVLDSSGRYLYTTLRNLNRLVVYTVDPDTGTLTPLQNISCGGANPRGFTLDPSGQYALVTNLESREIAIFRVMPDGTLQDTGKRTHAPSPGCLRFYSAAQ